MAKRSAIKEVELVPDAWPRFEGFIKRLAKAGPQHRTTKAKGESAKSPKGRKAVKKLR